jgi:HEAT repeat protein
MPLIRKSPANPADPRRIEPPPDATLLQSGTVQERWNAARAFEAMPGGTQLLGDALRAEADAGVREAIFVSLARIGSRESVDAVVPYLRSDDAGLRAGALDALRVMIEAVRPRLPLLLADPDPDVRILSCDLVRELPPAEASRLLCEVLDRDGEPNVCAAAVDVLADIGDASALASLNRCAERFHHEAFLTFAVKIAAGRLIASQPSGPYG